MMENSFIIKNLLQQNESVRLEFNSRIDLDLITITITALINTQGGDMIIGVDENKNVIGVENAIEQCNAIQNILVEKIKPIAPISVKVINYKGKDVILISVWEGAKKPYSFNNIIYNRHNKESIKAKPDKLSEIINDRNVSDSSWERMPILGAKLSDLDKSEIDNTIQFYKEYKENALFEDAEDFLMQLGLIQNGNITNACMVLFGNNPTRFIPQAKIRLTVYQTDVTGNKYLGDEVFDRNIFQNISKIFDYLDIEYGRSHIIEGLLREERFNYPRLAMRESVLNAIVHRDYNSVKSFLQISIYSDRTEVTNYGGLPEGITIKDLKIEHNSILRNPDIAKLCFIRKHIELLGGGTLRMINDCRSNKFKVPVWKEDSNILTVVFPKVSHQRKDEGITEGISKDAIANIEGIAEGATEGVTEEVKAKTRKILMLLYKEEGLNTNDIEASTGIPVKTLERYIKTLKDKGVISYKGTGKTGGYYIIDKALNKDAIDTKGAGKAKPDKIGDGVSDGIGDGVSALLNDGVNDSLIDGVTDGVRVEIIKITGLVIGKEGLNAMDIATKRGKSKSSIERYLRTAKEVGIIEFKGAPKTGGYFLTEKIKAKLK